MKNKKHQLSVLTAVLIATLISCGKKSGNPAEEIPEEPGVETETPKIIAFPGAEGYGKYATGGRGGKVVAVTNLENAGEGSLRWALSQYPEDPITVIFRVGGTIELTSDLKISRNNVTIAGQTAPGGGICLKGRSFGINGGKNIIIRYIRSRPGYRGDDSAFSLSVENSENIIIDHCSLSWANEETGSYYDIDNVTVQWCIFSEGLYDAGHSKGNRGYGPVMGGKNASYHHNLITNQWSRSPRFSGSVSNDLHALIDFRNNVIYNWGKNTGAIYGAEVRLLNGSARVNYVNNYLKPGPATRQKLFVRPSYGAVGAGRFYVTGNIMEGDEKITADNWLGVTVEEEVPEAFRAAVKSNTVFPIKEALPVRSAEEAYAEVLEKVGATIPQRDAVDTRIISETRTGTATGMGSFGRAGIIDDPAAVGGWPNLAVGTPPVDTDKDGIPDSWEDANGLNKNNADDGNKLHESGYTMLEMYLNGIK